MPAKRAPSSSRPAGLAIVREFKQERSAQTYERLLDAAERVFAGRGFDSAQTPEIAREAGVSTGALYRYFDDKRQLFHEMIARKLERAHTDVMAKLQPAMFVGVADKRKAIEVAIEVLFDHVQRDAELERVYLAMSFTDPEVLKLRAAFEARAQESLALLIGAVVPRSVAPNARAAAVVVQVAALEVAAERAGLRPRIGQGESDAEVKLALREMLCRYLFPDEEPVRRRRRS